MTTLQDNAVDPTFQNELISPARLLLLAPSEPRAPIAILSPAKRNALVACFNAGGLHKRDGAWHGPPDGKPVSGITTADLARDGMLRVTTNHRFGSARLTERGNWFARTLLCQGTTANSESVRFTRTRLSDIVHPVSSSQLTQDPDRVRSFGGYNTLAGSCWLDFPT